jgi:hypothetical protein
MSRSVTAWRPLQLDEIAQARKVFKGTIPYDQVVVSDGLGYDDRPFTMPTSIPMGPGYEVSGGKYVIHAGVAGYDGMATDEGFYGANSLPSRKRLLIHELTHVWQGEQSNWSWAYVIKSGWAQVGDGDAAYDYYDRKKPFLDYTHEEQRQQLKDWDEYNPEQQAQIVEDWFADGMNETADYPDAQWKDLRFYFIKKYIRGETVSKDTWDGVPRTPPPTPMVDPHDVVLPDRGPASDAYLLSLLQQRFRADDVAGYGGRVKKLQEYFVQLPRNDARTLLARLEARRSGDKVAQSFHDNLSTPTRTTLMGILRGK